MVVIGERRPEIAAALAGNARSRSGFSGPTHACTSARRHAAMDRRLCRHQRSPFLAQHPGETRLPSLTWECTHGCRSLSKFIFGFKRAGVQRRGMLVVQSSHLGKIGNLNSVNYNIYNFRQITPTESSRIVGGAKKGTCSSKPVGNLILPLSYSAAA